jgi:hypothetical protein
MDAEGKPFFEKVLAGSLSSEGAQLAHVHHYLKVGDVIGIQYGEKKARFEVVWAKASVGPGLHEAGVRILPQQSVPWGEIAPADQKPQSTAVHRGDKRRFPRLKLQFPVEISFPGTERTHMHCLSTDVSGRGCYVETLVPLPINADFDIGFWMESEKIQSKGVVRASHPGVGMGIEFVSLDVETQQRVQQFLEKLDQNRLARAASENN